MLQHGLFGAFLSPFPLTAHSLFLWPRAVGSHTYSKNSAGVLSEGALPAPTYPSVAQDIPKNSPRSLVKGLSVEQTYTSTVWKSYWPACELQMNLTSAREDSLLELWAFGLRKCKRAAVPNPLAEHCWTVAAGGQEQQGIATSLCTQEFSYPPEDRTVTAELPTCFNPSLKLRPVLPMF